MTERRHTVEIKDDQRYVVWTKGLRGNCELQIWYGDKLKGTGQRQKSTKKPFDEAEAGDIVEFYYMEPCDDTPEKRGEIAVKYPSPLARELPEATAGVKAETTDAGAKLLSMSWGTYEKPLDSTGGYLEMIRKLYDQRLFNLEMHGG